NADPGGGVAGDLVGDRGGDFLGCRLDLGVLGNELFSGLGDPLDELGRHGLAHVLASKLAGRYVVPELPAAQSALEDAAAVVAHLLAVDHEAETRVLKAVE